VPNIDISHFIAIQAVDLLTGYIVGTYPRSLISTHNIIYGSIAFSARKSRIEEVKFE